MDITQIAVALITLAGTITAAWFAFHGHRQSREVNDAVNRTHKDKPRIYDLVLDNTTRISRVETKVDGIIENCPLTPTHKE